MPAGAKPYPEELCQKALLKIKFNNKDTRTVPERYQNAINRAPPLDLLRPVLKQFALNNLLPITEEYLGPSQTFRSRTPDLFL